MAHIDYYFGTQSSFGYLAGLRLEEIAARHGASVTYKPLDLGALFGRTGGQPPKDRHPARQKYRAMDLARTAKKRGVPFHITPQFWPANCAPSSYAIIAAQNAGGGQLGLLAHSFMRASWGEQQDIADNTTIRRLLSEAGFDPDLADSGLLEGAETYARNLEEAVGQGVFGSPTYVVNQTEVFWGQDRLEDLDIYLSELG